MTLVITSGDPSGIGPDVILQMAMSRSVPAIVLGDIDVFRARAELLNLPVELLDYQGGDIPYDKGILTIQHLPVAQPVQIGQSQPDNAEYILSQLDAAISGCLTMNYSGMVTAPVNKAVINQAGHDFSGHTGYIAALCQTDDVVMMLACQAMRVALVTTHIPLAKVPEAITPQKLKRTIAIVQAALQEQFGIDEPRLMIAGLNPHAGEQGYLGSEEIDVIEPVIAQFDDSRISGPYAADTMFSHDNCQTADAFVAMYHDQGLAVLKYAGFGEAANITLGLPIIRTSVDHGTAYDLAGTGRATAGSLIYAFEEAMKMSQKTPTT